MFYDFLILWFIYCLKETIKQTIKHISFMYIFRWSFISPTPEYVEYGIYIYINIYIYIIYIYIYILYIYTLINGINNNYFLQLEVSCLTFIRWIILQSSEIYFILKLKSLLKLIITYGSGINRLLLRNYVINICWHADI